MKLFLYVTAIAAYVSAYMFFGVLGGFFIGPIFATIAVYAVTTVALASR